MDKIKDFLNPELIWFIIGIVLLVMEFALPGLIVFFFGVGAVIVAVVCLFVDISINAQLLIFIVASVLSLLCLRKWLKGIFLGHTVSRQNLKENLEEFLGQKATVVEKIKTKAGGKVEFRGTNWHADSDQEIEKGTVVEIIGKENITLKVKVL